MERLEGMDKQVHRVWADGREAAKELRLMGARDPQDQEVHGLRCSQVETTHGCRLAFR